ncbi:MAG: sodium/solute symporter [Opitutaceae bacterium]|nr:sodium/solute symporter [Opitutaceae bacterium]
MQFQLSTLDVVIILGSILFVVVVGILAGRKEKRSADDYFLTKGRLPWWIIGAAFVATSVSSEQIVGTAGAAFSHGLSISNWEVFALPCYTLLMVFFIPIYLKNRISTMPEFLERRFGSAAGRIYSYTMLFAYVFIFMPPVLYGGTLALADLTGWNFHIILWTTIALVAAYTVKGGYISVMYTDAVQCAMLLGGGLLLFFIALNHVLGGWPAMELAAPERFHLYRPPDDPIAPMLGLLAGSMGLFIFYQATNQVMIQRVLAARSTWDGLMGIVFAGFIGFLRPLVTCLVGLVVWHYINVMKAAPALATPDHAFPFALKHFAPDWGLRGIVLAGFLAAVMSTVSALANSTSTIFSLNIYQPLRPDVSDKELIRVGRTASCLTLVLAGLTVPLIVKFGGIFLYFQQCVTFLSTPIISVIFVGILYRRANNAGALFGLVGGFVIQGGIVALNYYGGWNLHWFYQAFVAELIIIVSIVVVSLLTDPPPREKWEPFHWRPSVLAHYDEGVTRPWYQQLKLWFGIYAISWVVLYWRYW